MQPKDPESPLWTWQALCDALGIAREPGPAVSGISIDTRTLEPGDLFIALSGDPGPRFHSSGSAGRDGHEFLAAAIDAGAAGAVVSKQVQDVVPTLCVDDTLDALWALGRAGRDRVDASVVAVTGSSGKTTARQWLEQVLRTQLATHASTGSLNNHWGVPLSLARMPSDARCAVFEIGTNNPGEIAPLSQLVRPDVALLLNVLPAHLGRFESLDAIRIEKLSISAGLPGNGTLIVPFGLDQSSSVAQNTLTFGFDDGADVSGTWRTESGRTLIDVRAAGERWAVTIPTVGEHRASTALGVVAVLHAMGLGPDDFIDEFSRLTIPKGRGNLEFIDDISIVDDSYNANPVSMRYALEALAKHEGQKVAILGEMLELGEQGVAMHRSLSGNCGDIDGVMTVGDGFAHWPHALGDRYWGHVRSADEIDLDALASRLEPGAQILVKGANKVFWVGGFTRRLADFLRSVL